MVFMSFMMIKDVFRHKKAEKGALRPMESRKDIKRRFIGRVEMKAAQAEIEALLTAGQPYAWIFDKLTEEGRLTISYRQFCRCLALYFGVRVRPKRKKGEKAIPVPNPAPEKKDWSIKGAKWDPDSINEKDLIG